MGAIDLIGADLDPALRRRMVVRDVLRPAMVDAAQAASARLAMCPGMLYEPRGNDRGLRMTVGDVTVGGLSLTYLADLYGSSTAVQDGLDSFMLSTVLRGRTFFFTPQAEEPVAVTGTVGVVARGLPGVRVLAGAGSARLNLWLPTRAVVSRLEALLGEPVADDLEFATAIDWQSPAGASIQRLVRLAREEIGQAGGMLSHDAGRRAFEELLALAMLQGLRHNHADRLNGRQPAPLPRHLKRAEAFLRANLERTVTLQDMADAAGCSLRALQIAFRRWRNASPSAVWRDMRLEAVRATLQRAEPAASIENTARRFGFTHHSRFARAYRGRYGEFPSQTIRRGRT